MLLDNIWMFIPIKLYQFAIFVAMFVYFPFFANIGEKGTACKKIFNLYGNQTWFIDDSPFQIKSVKKKESNIKTILFIKNHKLGKLVKNKNTGDFFSTSWLENENILFNTILNYE